LSLIRWDQFLTTETNATRETLLLTERAMRKDETMNVSDEDFEELMALAKTNEVMIGPSFMSRSNWRGQYQRLVARGLVEWGSPPPGFDPKLFAGTTITAKGRRAVLEQAQNER